LMPLSVRLSMVFLSKTQIWKDNYNRPDTNLHGPDARATYLEIVCIRSTVRTTCYVVRTRKVLIWKLRAAKVRPSGWQGNIVWTRFNLGKNFCEIWKAYRTVVRPDTLCLPSGRGLGFSKPDALLNLQPISRGPYAWELQEFGIEFYSA
jgi:hypothetical protein